MRRLIAVLLVSSLLLAGAGITMARIVHGPPEDALASIVPADPALYLSVFLDPSTRQGRSISAFFETLDLPEVDGSIRLCDTTLDRFADDGASQIGMFVLPSGATGCVTDSDRAPATNGPQARVRDRWVVGDPEAIAAAVETPASGSLSSVADFRDHVSRVGRDRVALLFVSGSHRTWNSDSPEIFERVLRFVDTSGAVALKSEGGRLVLDGSVRSDGASGHDLLSVGAEALMWVGGSRLDSGERASDRLAELDRYTEAEAWLDGAEPIAYVDARDARPRLALASMAAGIPFPTARLDRLILGANRVLPSHASEPLLSSEMGSTRGQDGWFSWRLVVAAAE